MSDNPLGNPSPRSGPDPVLKFLRISGDTDDPAVLLGVERIAADTAVLAALQKRLAQVSDHPEAKSFEADEVRMRLHAAAARLLELHMRTASTATPETGNAVKSGRVTGAAEASVFRALAMGGGWNRDSLHRAMMLARAEGVAASDVPGLLTGISGAASAPSATSRADTSDGASQAAGEQADGANETAKRPVAKRVVRTAKEFRGLDLPPATSPDELQVSAVPLSSEQDPGAKIVKWLIFGGIGVCSTLLIIATLGLLLIPEKPKQSNMPAAPVPVADTTKIKNTNEMFPAPPKTAEQMAPKVEPKDRVGDFGDLLRELRACGEGLKLDPAQASARFVEVNGEIARHWPEASPDVLAAAINGAVEFIYRAGNTPGARNVVSEITGPATTIGDAGPISAQQIAPAAWSAGMLSRLVRERDLPTSVTTAVGSAARNLGDSGLVAGDNAYRAGALTALLKMAPRCIDASRKDAKVGREVWRAWLDALNAIDGKDSALAVRALVMTLDSVLVAEAEPTHDRAVYDAIIELSSAMPWRAGDESRVALLRWFDSKVVSIADLHTITTALAERSGAEHVDITMVLSMAAQDAHRAELRDRYAGIWSLTTAQGRDLLVQKWESAADQAVKAGVMDTPPDRLIHTVTMARMNTAAWLLWNSQAEPVEGLISATAPTAPQVNPAAVGGVITANWGIIIKMINTDPVKTDGWAVRYLALGTNIDERVAALRAVSVAPNALDAAVMVEEAVRGGRPQIREAARALVLKYSHELVVLNALLEIAPLTPATTENAELMRRATAAKLPSARDPTWRVAVRRALVERLVEAMAAGGEHGYADVMEQYLAEAYIQRGAAGTQSTADSSTSAENTAGNPTAPAAASEPPPADVTEAARVARALLRRQAGELIPTGREPVSLGQIDSGYATRLRMSQGPVSDFAAEQFACCELLGFMCVAERPARAAAAAAVLDELKTKRREAKHVVEQIEATERAMLKLWLIRFGSEAL